ncbi:hypothetical protein HDU97_003913 [Phlyctochytrium planicorne]|nr:hypothetical protein HDU97_003913 [Phlyctochytrium planicorne]
MPRSSKRLDESELSTAATPEESTLDGSNSRLDTPETSESHNPAEDDDSMDDARPTRQLRKRPLLRNSSSVESKEIIHAPKRKRKSYQIESDSEGDGAQYFQFAD